MDFLVLLLPALPLSSALITYLAAPRLGRGVAQVSVGFAVAALLLAGFLLALHVSGAPSAGHRLGDAWGSLYFDPLGLLMGFVIALISLLVRMYSVRYMAEEAGYGRFFTLLDLMAAALLIMVCAADLITLLIAWHLIGVLLYFLLGQDTRSEPAYRYGFWTFITYRFGDLPLVLAAMLLYQTYGTVSLPALFERIAADSDRIGAWGLPVAETVAVLVGISAFARSAQFLLHNWLPYTMAGPTPVSALMHAGIVNAGGFLINRFAPVYAVTDGVLPWLFAVGLITAVAGSALMLAQSDVKKALGYSTMGQMGFMVMECGAGAFSLAIFHLIAHGLFKGTLFLGAGGVIGEARRQDGVPKKTLYTFIVERLSPGRRPPWWAMALITLIVPAVVFVGAHYWVAPDVLLKQGVIVLLFFGWITGAQLVFATYQLETREPWRLLGLMLLSFLVVVVGYSFISHAFERFLYPDARLVEALYQAAGIHPQAFILICGALAMGVVAGWFLAYAGPKAAAKFGRGAFADMRTGGYPARELWLNFYALLQREFHTVDLYAAFSRRLVRLSAKLNVWLRWG